MWSIATFAFPQAEIYIDMNESEMGFQTLLSKVQVISAKYLSNDDLSSGLMLISESVTIMSFRGWWFYGIMRNNREIGICHVLFHKRSSCTDKRAHRNLQGVTPM